MKIGIYAIRDAKTEIFSQPMYFVTPGVAIRTFGDEVENSNSNLSKHPEDYAMFKIGTFDDNTGAIEQEPQPLQIALAMDFKKA